MAKLKMIAPLIIASILFFFLALIQPTPAQAGDLRQESTQEYCLSCHSKPGGVLTLPSGEEIDITVTQEEWENSVHGPMGIECQACHTNITTYPHPKLEFETARQLSRSYYQACQKCHKDLYDKTLDSMHAQVAAQGNDNAPICTDCHGAHNITDPDQPRARISETCGQCHNEIYETYRNSVHGAALIQEDNPDVPVCTDCHGVHNIHDPRTEQFRVESPELCAGCHANEELMAKYGLSADVYTTYKLSWHGVDVAVYEARWQELWHSSAVCTDCHGTHNIYSTDNPESLVNPTNRLKTCQKCHPGAGPNFVGAWTGHYKTSLQKTPFLFYTESFYDLFVPFVLILSAVYVLLQIIRATVDRVRRNLE